MKKIALISGLLFFFVYFWANTFIPEDELQQVVYPAMAANPETDVHDFDEEILSRIMETEAPADNEGGYYLVVASFSDFDQAKRIAEKYKNDFSAEIIILPPTPQGYYRISYGRYSTLEDAGANLPAVRGKVSSEAWVYSME